MADTLPLRVPTEPARSPAGVADVQPSAGLDDLLRELRRITDLLQQGQAELLDAAGAATLLGVSPATLYRLVSAKRAPQPVHLGLGGRSLARWRRADLREFLGRLR